MKPEYKFIRMDWQKADTMSKDLTAKVPQGWEVVTASATGSEILILLKKIRRFL